MQSRVIYEDNHLIVINKPAQLATMGTVPEEPSLARELKAYLCQKYNKPGNAYLGIVSRLDSVTSGLIVFAKTSKAASRLTTQFQSRQVRKLYLAVIPSVHSILKSSLRAKSATSTTWDQWFPVSWQDLVYKDDASQRMRRVAPSAKSGPRGATVQEAKLSWRLLGESNSFSLVLIQLETGRKHQIRVQFAERNLPIIGDRKYGSDQPFPVGIALHSWFLTLVHPVSKTPLRFTQPPPSAWNSTGPFLPAIDLTQTLGSNLPLEPVSLIGRLGASLS